MPRPSSPRVARRSSWLLLCWALAHAPLSWAQAQGMPPAPPAANRPEALTEVSTEVVAQGLAHPWAVAFLPQGRFLVTERPGRMRVVQPDGRIGPALAGVPAVAAGGQGGLLDVVTDTDFARNRVVYFCFSEAEPTGTTLALPSERGPQRNGTALARAELSADLARLDNVRVIFRQQPKVASRLHFGCRIVQDKDTLFLTLGERFSQASGAQSLDNHLGKVVRIHTDGRIPADNPFASGAGPQGALPEIWSYGHRNPQGATLGPDGRLWLHEHGPMGGDEINRPGPGENFGWPLVSFGLNYNGTAVGEGQTGGPGLIAPLHHWTPSIAPSGLAWVGSDRYGPGWKGTLLVGSLKFGHLARLVPDASGGRVLREHKLVLAAGTRIRDVRQGPDGWLYLLTDATNGQLLRLLPAAGQATVSSAITPVAVLEMGMW